MANASLTKDINSDFPLYKANALRALVSISTPELATQSERYIKQALVHTDPYVASSALLAGLHLMKLAPDLVRRWVGEVQEASKNPDPMVQYHAVGLLYEIQRTKRLDLSKTVQQFVPRLAAASQSSSGQAASSGSSAVYCQLIRYACQVMSEEDPPFGGQPRSLWSFVEGALRHRSEAVMIEAAKGICRLRAVVRIIPSLYFFVSLALCRSSPS